MKNSPVVSSGAKDGHRHMSESVPKRKRGSSVAAGAGPSSADAQLSLSDGRVLDCPICFDSLTIPVFQCASGHILCSPCLEKLMSKCPVCKKKISVRNRAIESVLESLKVSCSHKIHGCAEKIKYCDKRLHEVHCVYAPYKCPFTGCVFVGSPRNLYMHLKKQHTSSAVLLSLNETCLFPWSRAHEIVVFLEKGDNGAIFILDMRSKRIGVSYLEEPNHSKGCGFDYSLNVSFEYHSIKGSFKVDSAAYPFCEKLVGTDEPLKEFRRVLQCYFANKYTTVSLEIRRKNEAFANTTNG